MFRRLRTRLILINLAVTTVVLVVAFTTIYLVAKESARGRFAYPAVVNISFPESSLSIINQSIIAERQASLNSLLASLITVGILVEIAVAITSYFFAETAIEPIRESYENQRLFIANASHEIKTPLAAISANLEAANITDNCWIDNVSHEVQLLTALNQELLALAQLDGNTRRATVEENLRLEQELNQLISTFSPRIESKHLRLTLKVTPKSAEIILPKTDFLQVVTILLDNAIKYSEHKVNLIYHERELIVENDGAKLSPEALPHIFERFYQADKSADGVGLGLAIAKSIADHHGWSLTASSDRLTRFKLSF